MTVKLILLAGLLTGVASAQSARMTFEGDNGREPMPLAAVDVNVRLIGTVAETTLTLKFLNPTDRRLEGEFVMPLPEGATVSSYALEVNGAMREAVSVEKERARNAYETIKRKMIDPGLVEREAGNVYRTRVFPVEPKLTKEMRIGYVESLKMVDGTLMYRLPLGFPGKVGEFSCNVRVDGGGEVKTEVPNGIEFKEGAANGRNVAIGGDLLIQWKPKSERAEVHTDGDYHWVSGIVPADTERPGREPPVKINLFWDASDSARQMNHKKVLQLLDAYFGELKNVAVNLRFVRNVCSKPTAFKVVDGNWDGLRAALENAFYDGATNFEKCSNPNGLSIFVTDAYQSSLSKESVCIHAGLSALTPFELRELRAKSIQPIELAKLEIADGLRELTFLPLNVEMSKADQVDFSGVAGDPFRIYRKGKPTGNLRVALKAGIRVLDHMECENVVEAQGLARRLWAQAWLGTMETAKTKNESKITDFAKEHKLVSDYTSLIVLERFEDYVRFRIPPPEEDLRKKYELEIAEQDARKERTSRSTSLRFYWVEIQKWHEYVFPWADLPLFGKLRQLNIWRRATEKVFTEDERDGENYKRIIDWLEVAKTVIKRKSDLKTKAEFDVWSRDVGNAVSAASTLWVENVDLYSEKLAVSVEGMVKTTGKVVSNGPLTLKNAIRKSGGVRAPGSGSRVSLYRLGKKITYNLLSRAYKPIYLRPGDMIVVNTEKDDYADYADDPFFGGDPVGADPADQPAIVEEPEYLSEGFSAGGGGSPFGNEPVDTKMAAGSVRTVSTEDTLPELGDFRDALENDGDALQLYTKLKGNSAQSDVFHIEAARILGDHGHAELQQQVLSNLLERNTSESALRRFAMWLAEFGKEGIAASYLKGLTTNAAKLDLARLLVRDAGENVANGEQGVRIYDQIATTDGANNELASHALIERNGLLARFPLIDWEEESVKLDKVYRTNMDADIRIVISSDRPIAVKVKEPGGSLVGGFHKVSECGGRLAKAEPGQWSYMMRRGLPGNYELFATSSGGAATVQVGFFTNWGAEKQTEVWRTVLLQDRENEIGTFELRFDE
jgi:hypothetical protein